MPPFNLPRILAVILAIIFIGSHRPFWKAVWVCCVLLLAYIATPRSRLFSGAHHRVPDILSGQRKSQSDHGASNVSDGRDRSSGDQENALKEGDKTLDESTPPPAEYPLQILHDNPKAVVDIVAVHGLGANPAYAWVWHPKNNPPGGSGYPDKPFNWLKELLPKKMSCRVMAFNYDSKWLIDAPQQRISDISGTLLNSLQNNRKEASRRPLIFIGHSFGGNLIEQAIVDASRNRSEFTPVAESTVGVVFLGTPHRGSPAASWGALLASLAPPSLVTEDRILRDLEQQSDTLTDRLHHFSSWLFAESVPVMCCFEQLKTNYGARLGPLGILVPPRLVVPESSACIDGHPKMSLHTDHLKINKFYGPEDPSFQLVYPQILRMAEGAETALERRRNPRAILANDRGTSGKLQECLRAMEVVKPVDILSEIQTQKEKRVGHTCEWILKREEFSAWGADKDPRLLRLVGSPGIGKTMMSTFLVETLQRKVEKTPDTIFAYFFCDDKDQARKTPAALLRSLVWQLLVQRNELFKHIQTDFEDHKSSSVFEKLFENFTALWRIFQAMLRDSRAGEVFILIDALDECEKSTRKALLLGINTLFQIPPTSGEGKFKFLITYRPEISDIHDELSGVGVSLSIDSSKVNADLAEYIEVKVEELTKRRDYNKELKDDIREALANKAGGTFLWVSLMFKVLCETPKDDVRSKLRNLPAGLNETYARILNENDSVDKQSRARFLLLSMVAARRPLKKIEIAAAFAIWKNSLVLQIEHLDDYKDICSSCGSLISLTIASNDIDTTVNFCHQSVKDFLLEDHSGSKGAWYHTSRDSANLLMLQVCWRYLSSDAFNHGNSVIRREGLPGTEQLNKVPYHSLEDSFPGYAFLKYASDEWEDHAIAIDPTLLDGKINLEKAPTLRDAWLLRTAEEGQIRTLKLLYERGASLNTADEYGRTPLSWAAGNGHETVVKLLLETGKVDLDSRDNEYGRTPLSRAAGNGHETVVKLLLETGKVDLDSRDKYGRTPLSRAAGNGHETVVKLLLETGKVDLDSRDKYGRTPLSRAAGNGHETVVKLLLETGKVDLDSRDKYGRTPLSRAAGNGHETVVKLLLETGKVDPDSRDNLCGRTPLSRAAENGHETVVKLLLETGKVDLDSRDNQYGRTPLSRAAENGHETVVKLLLETGKVDPDSRDDDGQTPLSWAAENGHETVVKLLLETGKVDLDSRDNLYSRTPLSWAARNGHETVVKLLLETGKVDLDSRDDDGRTPLSWAIENGHETVVKLLLETGKVDLDSRDNQYSRTPLSWAARNGHETVVKLLLETGKVDLDSRDDDGRTPLSWAIENGHETVVKLLLETGKVDLDSRDNQYSRTPLSWAARNGHETIVKLLLETGKVDLDSRDNDGRTPLSWAVENGHEAVVKLLRENGA
ncbi:hypothetical protein AYL99_09859 [Fonsecaea erecta]|uniref:NACHT domain-containing protein n=1 Tax=Fonsecaea erecta TaxID=1367422 RepID=A0A178Z7H0_9EURO|nr:hypothetical protein AYL99_09859 [Fonsecaea erecta]OAP55707.1 hypothetical protein AYL99_09859 [Fonsecaea erecta]